MRPLALVTIALLGLAGCARDDDTAELPAACTESGPAAFVAALGAAPAPVQLDGVRLSDCVPKRSSAAELQRVGSLLLSTAQRLGNAERVVALGYLVGALQRGAEDGPGLHLEIVRRVEQEARPFRGTRGFALGRRAGRTSG